MKIVILVSLFPPGTLGGTEIATYNLAKQLARRGHEIHVITTHDRGLPFFRKENDFYVHRIAWPKIRFIGIFSFWLQMLPKIRAIKPDIVHAQDFTIGVPALVIKKILKIPYVVWGRGTDVNRSSPFFRIIIKLLIQNADAVLALTEDMRKNLKKINNTEICVVPNGIDLDEYNTPISCIKNKKIILFVGRLHPVKGVPYLIIAMKSILDKIPDSKLLLVGYGNEKEMLEALTIQLGIQKHVEFVGKVTPEVVKTFMQQSDVFVLPSLSEGFPNVILEAMACGLPIVASRVGGIPDIITNEINGFLVENKDSDEMADKIILLLGDDSLRRKICDINKNLVKKYSWHNVIVEVEKIYQLSIT
jgi:glycosyltransferase involved in cell wall biosynthesis